MTLDTSLSETVSPLEPNPDQTITRLGNHAPSASHGSSPNLVGKVFAHKFQLTSFIGSGGMSEVYKARHLITGKTFAVKVLHEKKAQDELTVRRLRQEAQAAGALAHNNILGIHDFGIDESGKPFLVMDFIDGVSLAEALQRRGVLSLDRFLNIMTQVASALAHAQENNVAHRDLKPSNIMIMNVGGDEQAKIVDFGIAKLLGQDVDTIQRLTQTGETFGSPLYMSPEQCTGAQVDSRSDIYSFGCLMYEALTGQPPHMGETVFDTIHRHINSMPTELKAPQLDDASRRRIESIILRCLAKAPQDRFQKASQLEAELRKIEHATGAGALSHIENAWNLVQAKNAAKRKTKVPLLVSALILVSVLSAISSVFLVFVGVEFDRSYKRMNVLNVARFRYFQSYLEMTRIYKFGQSYLFTRDPLMLQAIDRIHWRIEAQFRQTDRVLASEPALQEKYRKLSEAYEAGVTQFAANLKTLPPSPEGISFVQNMSMVRKFAHQTQLQQDRIMHDQIIENDEMNVLIEKVAGQQRNLIFSGMFTLFLNGTVIATLIMYFMKQRALLIKQKEQITQSALSVTGRNRRFKN